MNIEIEHKKISSDGSEIRHDLLTGEWVIIAKGRGKRPDDFVTDDENPAYDQESDVFFDPVASGQEPDVLVYRDNTGEWTTRVFPNKFPAVKPSDSAHDLSYGPYQSMAGYGHHEVVVTRDGQRPYALLEQEELAEVIDAYRERYLALMREKDIRSINIFHNRGRKAGGSIIHPHSQIIALPVVPPSIARELAHAEKFYKQNNASVFDAIMEHEMETQVHKVYENDSFFVYCPFASERAFQMRIIPKEPVAYFERTDQSTHFELADALGRCLKALYYGLNDPDLNFYIRTAPCGGQDYPYYRWHIDIFPRTHTYAGFEFSTDIEIVPVSPEDAASFLREKV